MADQEENVEQQKETADAAAETPVEEAGEEIAEAAAEAGAAEAAVEDAGEEIAEAAAEAGAAEAAVEDAGEEIAEAAEEVAEELAEEAAAEEPAAAPEPAAEAAPAEAAVAEPEAPAEEYSWEMLHKKTVADLRDIAQSIEHEALQGYSTMHKEQLVPALCEALSIDAHAHHEVVGINKDKVKGQIRALKVERQAAVEAGNHAQLKLVRKRIKSLKRKIRRATV